MRTAPIGSVSDRRDENGTTKYPESLCLTLALPSSERRVPPPAGTLLPGHGSYRLIRQSRSALLSFGRSLVRGVSAGWYQPLLPAGPSRRYLCDSFPGCLCPCHGGSALFPSKRFHDGSLFETAAISLCLGPLVCSPPRSFLPLRLIAARQPRLCHPSRTR